MMKNLRVKIVVNLLLMMIISGICSLVIIAIMFGGKIEVESRNNQRKISSNILYLYNNTNLTLDKIMEINNNDRYEIEIISDLTEYKFNMDELKDNGIVQRKIGELPFTETMLRLGDNYVKISNNVSMEGIHTRTMFLIIVPLGISILIATILSSIFLKKILSPVRALSKGTEEVAKGDFTVQLDIPNDYEFGMLTKNFNRMVNELSSIETLRNDFISNVSHEIKTPLASIQGFAKLIQDSNLGEEEKREFTDIIINESGRLSKLVSNILKVSKLDNQDIVTEKVKFSLDEQIRCSILVMEPEWGDKNIELDIDLNEVYIVENEDLLQQVWFNLIGNAIKFTDEGGTIKVKLIELKDKIVVKISDNGIGMDRETQRHIFEKFYQGDKSHLSSGNGLGLSLVKRIIELCNGKISVQSELGIGTTFIVELKNKYSD